MTENHTTRVGLVTGASQGLGQALTRALAERGWTLVVDARGADELHRATADWPNVHSIPGDVADQWHRAALVDAVAQHGRLDLLINNASTLGPSPLPALLDLPLDAYTRLLDVDVVSPLALAQASRPWLAAGQGIVINVTSDAAAEAYAGWGGYGSAKAALEHLTAILAVEEPQLRWYAVDPGDLRTAMHQAAFPGEDISDRPWPETVVPAFLRLIEERPPSGRWRAADLMAETVA